MNPRAVIALLLGATACEAFGGDSPAPSPVETTPMDAGTDAPAPPGALAPAADFATGQQTPADIVTDTTSVYWMNRPSGGKLGAVVKVAKSGGAPLVLTDKIPAPYNMTADATHLYFTANNDGVQFSFLLLFRQDKAGGAAEQKQINANGTILGCTIQGGVVFFAQQLGSDYSVASVDANAPAWPAAPVVTLPTKLAAITVLAADLTHVYAASAGTILKIAKVDGQSAVFATTTGIVKAIAFDPDASSIYWADDSAIRSLATSAAGGAPKDLATGQPGPSAIAFDATKIYWTNVGTKTGDGSVRSVTKGGGVTQTISTGEVEPLGIAVDDSGLYWANHGDGRIRMARK